MAIARIGELDRYMSEIKRHTPLSRDEESAIARRYRDTGEIAAAHQLVVANLRFVVKIAHQYRGYGLKLLDIVQEGNVGLMHAVKKFDPERGYRLISYAVWWIRAYIQSFILKSWSLVKLGSGRVRRKLFFKLRSERSRLEQEAKSRGDDAADSTVMAEVAANLGVRVSDVEEMGVRMAARDFSLDAPVGEEGGSRHVDLLEAEDQGPVALIESLEAKATVHSAVQAVTDTLNVKEKYIVEHRLLTEEPMTLADIGSHFGVSRERIRQLEARVIRKIGDVVRQREAA